MTPRLVVSNGKKVAEPWKPMDMGEMEFHEFSRLQKACKRSVRPKHYQLPENVVRIR